MRIAIVGSRKIKAIDIPKYVSSEDEIVSGGAEGVDRCAAEYARKNGMQFTEFLPQYHLYGRAASIKRNEQIVDYADKIIVFGDGSSKGALSVINYAKRIGKVCEVVRCEQG